MKEIKNVTIVGMGATPYSVTMLSTTFLVMLTMAPSVSIGDILDMVPFFAVDWTATIPLPPREWSAP